MSNQAKGTNGTKGEENPVVGTKKESLRTRAAKRWDTFRLSTGGRWAIRGGKALLAGLGLFGAYKAGQKSVKPTVIYVEHGVEEVTEEEPEVKEEPDQEAVDEA